MTTSIETPRTEDPLWDDLTEHSDELARHLTIHQFSNAVMVLTNEENLTVAMAAEQFLFNDERNIQTCYEQFKHFMLDNNHDEVLPSDSLTLLTTMFLNVNYRQVQGMLNSIAHSNSDDADGRQAEQAARHLLFLTNNAPEKMRGSMFGIMASHVLGRGYDSYYKMLIEMGVVDYFTDIVCHLTPDETAMVLDIIECDPGCANYARELKKHPASVVTNNIRIILDPHSTREPDTQIKIAFLRIVNNLSAYWIARILHELTKHHSKSADAAREFSRATSNPKARHGAISVIQDNTLSGENLMFLMNNDSMSLLNKVIAEGDR